MAWELRGEGPYGQVPLEGVRDGSDMCAMAQEAVGTLLDAATVDGADLIEITCVGQADDDGVELTITLKASGLHID